MTISDMCCYHSLYFMHSVTDIIKKFMNVKCDNLVVISKRDQILL